MDTPTVFVIDDDEPVRDALRAMLEATGLRVRTFAEGEEFLGQVDQGCRGCVLLDVAMPGMTGHRVHAELVRREIGLPVIFLTAFGDVPGAVRAMRAGAVDFLEKPFDGKALILRVREALEMDQARAAQAESAESIRVRLQSLTRREQQVLRLMMTGMANKEIARELGISFRTVEIHRSRVLRKMQAESMLELASMASASGIALPDQQGGFVALDPEGRDASET